MKEVVNCSAYRFGQRLGEIAIDDIAEVIRQEGTFVWLGLHDPNDALMLKIQEEFGLHELAVEDAQSAHQRPKLEEYGDALFIVLQTAQCWENQIEFGETHIFVGINYLISIRHGSSRSYAPVRARCEETPERLAKGPGFALYAIMDFVVDNYMPIVDALRSRFEALEADIFHDRFDRKSIERLYHLKQDLLDLRNAAAPLIEVCQEFMRLHQDLVPKELHAYFRDVQDHVKRLTAAADNLREMLTDAMQVNAALIAVKQSQVFKNLAAWGAIVALPLLAFNLYGMNFRSMPELQWPFAYPVLLLLVGVGCYAIYRRLKRSGWL